MPVLDACPKYVELAFRCACPYYELNFDPEGVAIKYYEGGVRVCGDAVLRYFWCGFAVIFILTHGIAVSKH